MKPANRTAPRHIGRKQVIGTLDSSALGGWIFDDSDGPGMTLDGLAVSHTRTVARRDETGSISLPRIGPRRLIHDAYRIVSAAQCITRK
jgi:hypothetical protein